MYNKTQIRNNYLNDKLRTLEDYIELENIKIERLNIDIEIAEKMGRIVKVNALNKNKESYVKHLYELEKEYEIVLQIKRRNYNE